MRVIFGCDVDDFEDISEKPVRVSPAHVVHQDPAGPVLGEVLAVLRCQEVPGQLRSVATHLDPLNTWPELFFLRAQRATRCFSNVAESSRRLFFAQVFKFNFEKNVMGCFSLSHWVTEATAFAKGLIDS